MWRPRLPGLGEERRGRLAVERLEDERARDVERAAGERRLAELVGAQRVVRPGGVQEGALAGRVDERDARRRSGTVGSRITPAPSTPRSLEEPDEEVAERVRADLAEHGGAQPEPCERARGVQRAAAAAEDDRVDERERADGGQRVDRACDHVGDEDPEADDVGQRWLRTRSVGSSGRSQIRSTSDSPTQSAGADGPRLSRGPSVSWRPCIATACRGTSSSRAS